MSSEQAVPAASRQPGWFSGATLFATTILVSAFLLFQVQPLVSKSILPWFGGSPAVWTTCMLFFQVLLFCGYLYAHLSEHVFPRTFGTFLHLALLAGALAMLPITPDPYWKPAAGQDPTWRILCLLTVTVGLPYFVLSTTGPLVQAWFSRVYPGRSPYRLYSLSNAGSLAALLSYPFIIEPNLNVGLQARIWSGGFLLFAGCCAAGAWQAWKLVASARVAVDASEAETAVRPNSWMWSAWLLLPAFASLMLLATTNYVCQDVAVIPFLWVVPLSLYLLSFIICFDHERWYDRRVFGPATAVLGILAAGFYEWTNWVDFEPSFVHEIVIFFSLLFGVCMVSHGELVRLRPPPRYLTSFYLMISAGGALGGVFVSLVAPLIFTTFYEYTLGLIGSYVLGAVVLLLQFGRCPASAASGPKVTPVFAGLSIAILGGLGAVFYFQRESSEVPVAQTRNFYGEITILERASNDPAQHDFALRSGGVLHGVQFVHSEKRLQPTTYYGVQSGVGQSLAYFQDRAGLHVGAVGLGVGTLSAYARPGQSFRFYEINPDMLRLARQHFSYLSDCRGAMEVVLGDARLSLEGEAPHAFDVLVLDAFSGDSVPAHLLTREAFQAYLRHLKPDGAICVHIQNSYLDLAPVVRGVAEAAGLKAIRIISQRKPELELYKTDWMLLSRNEKFLESLRGLASSDEDKPRRRVLWTDDYSNLFGILK